MNIEELHNYCLSLSPDVEEKFPFTKFKAARDILVFYINGYMFCYFDINNLSCVSVKSTPDDVCTLREHYDYIGLPYNANANFAKSWIGIDIHRAERSLVESLIATSFAIISKQKKKKTHQGQKN